MTGGSLYVCSAESAESRKHDSVAAIKDADMKLSRCVAGTKVQVEDGCGASILSEHSGLDMWHYG